MRPGDRFQEAYPRFALLADFVQVGDKVDEPIEGDSRDSEGAFFWGSSVPIAIGVDGTRLDVLHNETSFVS